MQNWESHAIFYGASDQTVLMMLRDGNTNRYPWHWAWFGGKNESPDRDPVDTCIRETKEETGILILPEMGIRKIHESNHPMDGRRRHVFLINHMPKPGEVVLTEGAGFAKIPLALVHTYQLASQTVEDVQVLLSLIDHTS